MGDGAVVISPPPVGRGSERGRGWGKGGSFLSAAGGLWAVFCPACVPALAVFLSSIGLGILADFFVSRGVMLVFLGLAFIALHASALVHRRILPFALAIVSGMLAIFSRNVYLNQTLAYVSGAGLVAAAILDYVYRRRAPAITCAPIGQQQPHGNI